MKMTTFGAHHIGEIRFDATRMNRTFDRIRHFSELVFKRTGVSLTLGGKPLMNYKAQDALQAALAQRGATLLTLETNLKLFADALEQYDLIYAGVFRGSGIRFVGEPEVEAPLSAGNEKSLLNEWVKNFIVSNIFGCAMHLNESIALQVILKDVPIHTWKQAFVRGASMDWDIQSAHEAFLTLFLLEEAMDRDVVRLMLEESVSLHEIRGAILRFASEKGVPVKVEL